MDESFDDRFQQFFKIFSQQLFQILPPGARARAFSGSLATALPRGAGHGVAMQRDDGPLAPAPAARRLRSRCWLPGTALRRATC